MFTNIQIGGRSKLTSGNMNVMAIYPGFGASLLGAFLSRPNEIRPQVIIENRDYAVSTLISHMESGHLPAVPIWDDLATFNAIPWTQRVDLVLAGWSHLGLEDKEYESLGKLLVALGRPTTIMEFRPDVLYDRPRFIAFGGFLQSLGFQLQVSTLSAAQIGHTHSRRRLFVVITPAIAGTFVADNLESRPQGTGRLESDTKEISRKQGSGIDGNSESFMDGIDGFYSQLPLPPAPNSDDWTTLLDTRPDLAPALPESVIGHLCGMADGFSNRLDRLWVLGGEGVPQVWATVITSVVDNLLPVG